MNEIDKHKHKQIYLFELNWLLTQKKNKDISGFVRNINWAKHVQVLGLEVTWGEDRWSPLRSLFGELEKEISTSSVTLSQLSAGSLIPHCFNGFSQEIYWPNYLYQDWQSRRVQPQQ